MPLDVQLYSESLRFQLSAVDGIESGDIRDGLEATILLDALDRFDSDLFFLANELSRLQVQAEGLVEGVLENVDEKNSVAADFEREFNKLQDLKNTAMLDIETLSQQIHAQMEVDDFQLNDLSQERG